MARELVKKLKFTNEPPRFTDRRREELTDLLVQLIDNPGKWAIIEVRDNPQDRAIDHIKAIGGKGFDIRTRLNEKGQIDVWACYKPEDE